MKLVSLVMNGWLRKTLRVRLANTPDPRYPRGIGSGAFRG